MGGCTSAGIAAGGPEDAAADICDATGGAGVDSRDRTGTGLFPSRSHLKLVDAMTLPLHTPDPDDTGGIHDPSTATMVLLVSQHVLLQRSMPSPLLL